MMQIWRFQCGSITGRVSEQKKIGKEIKANTTLPNRLPAGVQYDLLRAMGAPMRDTGVVYFAEEHWESKAICKSFKFNTVMQGLDPETFPNKSFSEIFRMETGTLKKGAICKHKCRYRSITGRALKEEEDKRQVVEPST